MYLIYYKSTTTPPPLPPQQGITAVPPHSIGAAGRAGSCSASPTQHGGEGLVENGIHGEAHAVQGNDDGGLFDQRCAS